MQEDNSKKSIKDRIKPHLRSARIAAISGAVTGAAVIVFYQTVTRVTWCHITMEQVDQLREQGQGVIGFGMDSKHKILVALPDIVD